jgi:uncharacterized membrane protein YkvA (DUF1232 family)
MQFKNFDFSQILRENTSSYQGDHEELIKASPDIFNLLVKLLDEPDLSNTIRTRIFSVIGYFFVVKDLFPEDENGAIGYIDDLMISISVLKDVEFEAGREIIESNYTESFESYLKITNEKFNAAREEYVHLYNEVIEFLGF